MKILYVVNQSSGFANKFLKKECMDFNKCGWIVDIAARMDVPFLPARNCYNMSWNRNPFTVKLKDIFHLKKIILKEKYDLIYCATPAGGFAARITLKFIKKNNRPKCFYACHGAHFYSGAPLINNTLFYWAEVYLSKFTNMIMTINDEDFNNFSNKPFKCSHVFKVNGAGVDLKKYRVQFNLEIINKLKAEFAISKNEIVIGYVAEVNKNKNQKLLVDAVKILKDFYDIKLILIGRVCDDFNIKKYIEEQELDSRIILTGHRDDVPALLDIIDIYAASSKREGLGLNIIEAMCSSIPCVALDNRGHRELIQDGVNGYLVYKNDPVEFADKIKSLLDSKFERDKFVRNSLEKIEKFDYKEVHPIIVKNIEKIVKADS